MTSKSYDEDMSTDAHGIATKETNVETIRSVESGLEETADTGVG